MIHLNKPYKYYTIYDDTTEEIVVYGTRDECIKKLHMTPGSFYSMISNIRNKTNKKYHKYSVVIEQINPLSEQSKPADD